MSDSRYLSGTASSADGAVLLAEGRPAPALAVLRRAVGDFTAMAAPYEAARCRVRLADACRAHGDVGSAELELDAARDAFAELGAVADLRTIARSDDAQPAAPAGLTKRELEILRMVATGAGNRAIAQELFLSEKTVARHVANIFGKLDVSSRAAATAYAYAHGLA